MIGFHFVEIKNLCHFRVTYNQIEYNQKKDQGVSQVNLIYTVKITPKLCQHTFTCRVGLNKGGETEKRGKTGGRGQETEKHCNNLTKTINVKLYASNSNDNI